MAGEIILVVEDEIGIRELIQMYLERHGYIVLTAGDGEEALRIMEDKQPQLILLDIEMPHMDGFDVCRRIRERYMLPILFLSSRLGVEDKLKCFELGGDDYITKPFNFVELKARIEANLRRYNQYGPIIEKKNAIIKHGGLEVDLQRYQFTLHGEPLELTAKEAQLLLIFVQHPNKVWSTEKLYDYVWGLDASGNMETVKVHMSNLRRKLEQNQSDSNYIQTVRGFGYILNTEQL